MICRSFPFFARLLLEILFHTHVYKYVLLLRLGLFSSLHGLLVYGLQDFVWTLLLMERCCAVGRREIGVTMKLTLYPTCNKMTERPSGLVTCCIEYAFCSTLFEGNRGRRVEMIVRRGRRRHKQLLDDNIETRGCW